jgi:hypothetical protein
MAASRIPTGNRRFIYRGHLAFAAGQVVEAGGQMREVYPLAHHVSFISSQKEQPRRDPKVPAGLSDQRRAKPLKIS